MTGSIFNSGSIVYNSGTITGRDVIINNGQDRDQRRRTGAGGGRPLVFINYRGADAAWAATVVWQVWVQRLGEDRVFLDNRSIRFGEPFDEELLGAVRASAVLLAIIGRQWYGEQPDGSRLIDDENDWVRREIRHALEHKVPVVPVMVEGIQELRAQELPDELAILARFQYCTIRQHYWRSDLDGLLAKVCELDERLAAEAGDPR